MADTSVKVAVRVRPLVDSEKEKGCRDVLDVVQDQQIIIRTLDKSFTFNYVLDTSKKQEDLYNCCVKNMLDNLFKGYNCTIFAYGQTGSGKTFTMGTAGNDAEGERGVVQRAVYDIFNYVRDNFSTSFSITTSFIELYQEVLYDLLSEKTRDQCLLEIREDPTKGIYMPGLTEVPVTSAEEVLKTLAKGSFGRVTSSTNMNAQSSRSHAIFTINISMHIKGNIEENKTAKLHLVDLAGSERPKKTGAVGNTFKEGVNINKGLFVLGNVISCLGDEKQQNGYIPYRDSNLTRLLKDSLGGNSITLMIACVSPADYNLDETISTLRYADRARKIKNKPIVNQDAKVAEINELKKTIQQLRLQIIGQGGAAVCPEEINKLKCDLDIHKEKLRDLSNKLSIALIDKTGLHEKILILQNANDALNKKITDVKEQYNNMVQNILKGLQDNDINFIRENIAQLEGIQEQFNDINQEQQKTASEIRDHEETFGSLLNTSQTVETQEVQEKQELHTKRQVALNTELEDVIKKLRVKEHLAEQLATNAKQMIDYEALAETESKLNMLQREKEELLQQLKSVKSQETTCKIAEQRRKKVQELEAQISNLRKKVLEQSRLIKLKDKDEQRIRQLNQEIIEMKKLKVKLIKNMREESNKFRLWKSQQNRELAKIRDQDRKKATEIAHLKIMHQKQQNVFKRKAEEAAALNRRLKEALALRQQVQASKASGQAERVGPWLKQEFNVFINLVEAEATLGSLLEDRGTLQKQLDELKANGEAVESEEVRALEEDIELRSAQITELQQKLLDSDDEKTKHRFDNVQTMAEAKYALKMLFDLIAEVQKEKVQTTMKINEMQDVNKELQEATKKHEDTIRNMELKHAGHLSELNSLYEEKINILLKQLRGIKSASEDASLNERLQIQEEQLELQEKKISTLENQNQELRGKVEELQIKLKQIQETAQQAELKKHLTKATLKVPNPEIKITDSTFIVESDERELAITKRKQKAKGSDEKTNATFTFQTPPHFDEDKENPEDISFEDDTSKDPDWRKTPLGKRIMTEKEKFAELGIVVKKPLLKRSSEGGCACTKDCTKRCGCRRANRGCNSTCKCSSAVCLNRDENIVSTTSDADSTTTSDDQESFKKPRITIRKTKGRTLFSGEDNL